MCVCVYVCEQTLAQFVTQSLVTNK